MSSISFSSRRCAFTTLWCWHLGTSVAFRERHLRFGNLRLAGLSAFALEQIQYSNQVEFVAHLIRTTVPLAAVQPFSIHVRRPQLGPHYLVYY
ncbi:hypothetical protein F5888DRAFT_113842 [Russula emetica]|nr:hypothetical protein F5888DRAFT_113842 [Russula emetica]